MSYVGAIIYSRPPHGSPYLSPMKYFLPLLILIHSTFQSAIKNYKPKYSYMCSFVILIKSFKTMDSKYFWHNSHTHTHGNSYVRFLYFPWRKFISGNVPWRNYSLKWWKSSNTVLETINAWNCYALNKRNCIYRYRLCWYFCKAGNFFAMQTFACLSYNKHIIITEPGYLSGIALGYGLDDRGVRVPTKGGNFSLLHCVQTGSWAHRASYPMGNRNSSPGGKVAGAWSWPLTSIYVEVNECVEV
jgi:hypothetical protein